MRIRVSVDRLNAAASEAERRINVVAEGFSEIDSLIRNTGTYWEGIGQAAFVESYNRRLERIESSLRMFRENVNQLRQIAGVYSEAEAENMEATEPLSGNVIV